VQIETNHHPVAQYFETQLLNLRKRNITNKIINHFIRSNRWLRYQRKPSSGWRQRYS